MGYSPLANVTSEPGSGFDRARVDVGQTGFYEGREFRAYYEFSAEKANAIEVGGVLRLKFFAPIDFVLQGQVLNIDAGGAQARIYRGATEGSGWVDFPTVGPTNTSPQRRVYPNGYYTQLCTIKVGGTFTGGTEGDLLRCRTPSQSVTSSSGNISQDAPRYRPAGTYFIEIRPLLGVNDPTQGTYELTWEERP